MNLSEPRFTDPNAAREWLEARRWPNGRTCPHCGNADQEAITGLKGKAHRPGVYQCNACREQFTVTVGTVMERSKIPLHKWVMATHLMAASKKGVSAHQLHRMLGLTYKTAWFMAHRLREAMRPATDAGPIGGEGKTVEADETYYGKAGEAHVSPNRTDPYTKRRRGQATKMAVDEEAVRLAYQAAYIAAKTPYWLALGRFADSFAILENVMRMMLTIVVRVNAETARAIFSGTRMRAAMDQINRTLDATGRHDEKEKLKPFFDQASLLLSMRDDILHHGANIDNTFESITVTNAHVAHIPSRVREIEMSPNLLDAMRDDVDRVISGVILILAPDALPQKRPVLDRWIARPWRYKLPAPKPQRGGSAQGAQRPPRQPQPSDP